MTKLSWDTAKLFITNNGTATHDLITFHFCFCSSSIIRQKSKSQNGGDKKRKDAKFKQKKNNIFSTQIRTRAYQEARNVRFSENLACSDFLLLRF